MSKLTLDPATAAVLATATEGIECVGPDGTPLGTFYPPALAGHAALALERRRQALDWGKSQRSIEDLQREEDDAPYTMDDVFKLLERA